MPTVDGLLDWYVDEDGLRCANIRVGERHGTMRLAPFGKLTRVEVMFPLIASSSGQESTYLLETAQSWLDNVGGEPLPRDE